MLAAENCSQNQPVPLSSLCCGRRGRVVSVGCCDPQLQGRLYTMGVVPGAEVEVTALAPLGDPMELRLLGYKLSLRLTEAAAVFVILNG